MTADEQFEVLFRLLAVQEDLDDTLEDSQRLSVAMQLGAGDSEVRQRQSGYRSRFCRTSQHRMATDS